MDATPFYKLARLLPIALVCFLTSAPALEAEESSTIVFAESNASNGSAKETNSAPSTDTQSASGTLVIVTAARPKSAVGKSSATRAGNRSWRSPSERRRKASSDAVDQPIQLASNQEEVAAPRQLKKTSTRRARRPAAKLESSGPTAEMLVYAHELSQQASTEADFEDVAIICDTAERLGVSGEQLEFSLQLQAWATKHRDQMRIERIQEQLRTEKSAQQLRARQAKQKLHVQRAKQQLLAAKAEKGLLARRIQERLRAEKAEEELRAEKAQQQLCAEVVEQQLRAERAEQQLRGERAEQQLRAERAEQQLRAERAEQQSHSERAELELAEVGTDTDVQASILVADGEIREETPAVQSQSWQQLHDRGVTFAEQGKYAEALDDFNRVIELNPMFAKAYANRATLFTQSGDLEWAQADYQRSCMLDPKLLHAQLGLGRVYHLLGSKEEALDCFNQAVELDPDNVNILCSRADLLADMGRYRDALADYARTIDLNPEFAHAYRNGAWLLATCPKPGFRDPTNAVRGAQRALDLEYGERHVALDTLAAAQASAGDFDLAIETLQKALKIAPHEARYVYRSRLQRYQAHQPFFTDPVEDVSQVVYEVSDQ